MDEAEARGLAALVVCVAYHQGLRRCGTAHADMDAHQLLACLCALVPPKFHMDPRLRRRSLVLKRA